MGFPGSSAGKESTCKAGDPSSIPESGRSAEEGIGYPLQYSWASLVAHLQYERPGFEPWVGKIPWRRESVPVFWPGESHGQRKALWASVHGIEKSWTRLSNFHSLTLYHEVKVTQSCPTFCIPICIYSPWNSPGQNTGVGRLSLLQGISPTQGSNPGLLQCRWILYQLSHKGSPRILEWIVYSFSSISS